MPSDDLAPLTAFKGDAVIRCGALEMRATISRILEDEDVEGLLAMGAPADEYEGEAEKIAAGIGTASELTVDAVFRIVQSVWIEMFGPFDPSELQRREKSFGQVAQRILDGK